MKFLTLILACYTFALSIAPCNDIHEGQTNVPMTIQAAQEHHQEDNDICSPFCLCSCCQGFVVISTIKNIQVVPSFSKGDYALYNEQVHSSFAANHWQPPRLG
ncbi:MAG: DUF6660 family protein [Bacteroidota bacterium]